MQFNTHGDAPKQVGGVSQRRMHYVLFPCDHPTLAIPFSGNESNASQTRPFLNNLIAEGSIRSLSALRSFTNQLEYVTVTTSKRTIYSI